MQDLAWLLIGWGVGLLTGVAASLLIFTMARRMFARTQPGPWTASRILLLLTIPFALIALGAGGILLARQASAARELVIRREARAEAEEAFRRSQETAQALADSRWQTATAAARPSESAVVVASTSSPTDTPVPGQPDTTDTPAASPEPGVTPGSPTATLEPPTETAEPTRTKRPTPRPTKRPTKQPTVVSEPQLAWTGEIVGAAPSCKHTQVEGLTLTRDGGLAPNIWVHYWADNWSGAWAVSKDQGSVGEPGEVVGRNWDGFITPYPREGTWKVCVVPGDGNLECISNQLTATTVAAPCEADSQGVQVVRIVFRQN